jgi:PTH1 family peptidyl-tRNA hydrolase
MKKIRWSSLNRLIGLGVKASISPETIVVGLGNPGDRYRGTRHNAGFWCVDRIASDHAIDISRRQRRVLIGEGTINGSPVVVARPRTYVNSSGEAVEYLLVRYSASPQQLLVVYDDMDLPLGKLRIRPTGNAGGHNGVTSIIDALGTREFPRLRIGIGRPSDGVGQIDHVLGTMSPDDRKKMDYAVERAAKAVGSLISDGITEAMNKFN